MKWPNADDYKEHMKNKEGSNFLVLKNDHDSSKEETELTISHKHLVAVQKVDDEEES